MNHISVFDPTLHVIGLCHVFYKSELFYLQQDNYTSNSISKDFQTAKWGDLFVGMDISLMRN